MTGWHAFRLLGVDRGDSATRDKIAVVEAASVQAQAVG
jgi:hypothetical protein